MSRSGSYQFNSVREPSEILSDCTQYFAMAGWTVTLRTEDVATFSHANPVGCATVALLLLLGVIPGLLYLIARTRTLSVTVTSSSHPVAEGALTQLSWSHEGALALCNRLVGRLEATEEELDDDLEYCEAMIKSLVPIALNGTAESHAAAVKLLKFLDLQAKALGYPASTSADVRPTFIKYARQDARDNGRDPDDLKIVADVDKALAAARPRKIRARRE